MNDQKVVEYIKGGKRNKSLVQLYKGFPAIKKMITSNGGTRQEAEDIFQEALIIFYQKAKQENFVLTSSISTYLYSVSRYLWKDKHKQQKYQNNKFSDQEYVDEYEIEIKALIEKEQKIQLIEEVLLSIGEKCLKILQLFYYKKYSMKEIARQVDLKSEKVAKNQKYKCLERARKSLSASL